jgi:hypothetical protein
VRQIASSFSDTPGTINVSRKSNLTYTSEVSTDPTIVAVTSPSVEQGIIAPVTPAQYVKIKISEPLIQDTWLVASALSRDVQSFVNKCRYTNPNKIFAISECRRTSVEP